MANVKFDQKSFNPAGANPFGSPGPAGIEEAVQVAETAAETAAANGQQVNIYRRNVTQYDQRVTAIIGG